MLSDDERSEASSLPISVCSKNPKEINGGRQIRNRAFPDDLEKFQYQGTTDFRTEAARQEVRRCIASEHFGANEANGLWFIKGTTSSSKVKKTDRIRWHCSHKNTGLCKWVCEEVKIKKDDGNCDNAFFRIGTTLHSGHDRNVRKRGLSTAAKELLSSCHMKTKDWMKKCKSHGISFASEDQKKKCSGLLPGVDGLNM